MQAASIDTQIDLASEEIMRRVETQRFEIRTPFVHTYRFIKLGNSGINQMN